MNSYWIESTNDERIYKKIDKDYEADVCIIGAGLAGLSTGYYLAKNGLKVIIVDKDEIGVKASGNTTAKITYQHGLIYDYLISEYGEEFALGYYQANKEAITNIKDIIDEEEIDCDFEYASNYIYTTDINDLQKLENEVDAINKLEMKSSDEELKETAQLINESELPFKITAGIKTVDQAQFHPRKYMLGLARTIENSGGTIFTHSTVVDVKHEDDYYYTICGDEKIKSKYVVIASHYPFINFPGLYFSKMYQVTSYALGIETSKSEIRGMYLSSNEPTLSFRTAKYGKKRLLIMAGGNHKTGYSPDSEENYGYKFLEKKAKELFPRGKVLYKWNTRDCITLDKIPYIGEFSNLMPNMFVATGFNKWGMTSSNVAANIITDKIIGKENQYEKVFDSTRLKPIKNKDELMNMAEQAVKSFVTNRIKIPKEDISTIEPDNGGILNIDGKKVGVYKTEEGNIYVVNPTCTHLGCLLTWNNQDKTWDCPCHGSRFDYTGKNLYDPAFKDLERIRDK